MIEDVRAVQRNLEDTYAQSQEAIEAKSLQILRKRSCAGKGFPC